MKIYGMFIKIIIGLFVIFTLFILCMYFTGNEPAIIVTGSMRPKMGPGSIVFIDKDYPFENFNKGDILVYISKDKKVVHRVVEVTENGYRTKGDANPNVDVKEITKDIYYGKCALYIPYAGMIIMAFQSSYGKVCLIILLVLLFATYCVLNDMERTNKRY